MTTTQNTKAISIFFRIDKNGRRTAYRLDRQVMRNFRIGLDEAELMISTGAGREETGSL